MKYMGMPMGMWALFAGSFQKQLTAVFGYDADAAQAITKKAKPKYKAIIADLPEFEKADRFKMNIVNCAMLGTFILSMPERPDVERLTEYYAKSMMTKPMKWFCRKSGKNKFTPKDISGMKATATLKAADRNPYSWNMEFYEYPDGSDILCGELAFSALTAEPLHGRCHHRLCVVIRQAVYRRALRHGENERAEHCAVDDVHLEAVCLFKLRQIGNNFSVFCSCFFGDILGCIVIIAEYGGQLVSERWCKQCPHPHGHSCVFHCLSPNPIFTICIFIIPSPTFARKRKKPLTDGSRRLL